MPETTRVISIVGGETAIGRDLRERLSDAGVPGQLQLIGAEDEISGILSEQEGELVVMTPLDADRLHASTVVFGAGSPESTKKAYALLASGERPQLIDLTYALEDLPEARLRAPRVEPPRVEAKDTAAPDGIQVLAHPAAVAITLVLSRLHARYPIRHSVVHVFEPASERGQAGMNELQQQSTGLLSFQQLNKAVFDAQIGFNVLPQYGEDAPLRLEDVETRIERHTATLLSRHNVPMPSLRLIQVPVFHGYSVSFWIEFESRPSVTEIEQALASADIEVRESDLEAPTNVGAVGQEGIIAGKIELDRNQSRAAWIWAVADNFRLLVDAAVDLVKESRS